MYKIICLIVAICNLIHTIDGNVPVLIWTTTNNELKLSPPALKSFNDNEFMKLSNTIFTDKSVFGIVFTEDILTSEEFSTCKATVNNRRTSCYGGLQNLRNKLYLSNVENPINQLKSIGNDVYNVINMNDVDADAIQFDNNLLFIKLSENKYENDKFMVKTTERVSKELPTATKVIFIYTGMETIHKNRYAREAVAADDSLPPSTTKQQNSSAVMPKQTVEPQYTPVHYNSSDLLLYFTSLYSVDPQTRVRTPIIIGDIIIERANPESSSFSVALTDNVTSENRITFDIVSQHGHWYLENLNLTGVGRLHIREKIAANTGFSFHCQPELDFRPTISLRSVLVWGGLQIEPTNRTTFSDSWDCVGFTSAGIWGGIFVTVLLLSILSIGLSCIMDIRTMDRFDDPKGKTIIVNVTE